MAKFFINRPVLAIVLSLVITLAGALCIFVLPIAQYPDIAPPTVQVSASYTGANADTVQQTVAAPIEQAVNGVENLLYMQSTSTNDGTYTLTLTFKTGTNGDIAAVNVQNRINQAQPFLPAEVTQAGISVNKQSTSIVQVISLYSPDNRYDSTFLSNYAKVHVLDELARVPGVGAASGFATEDYAIRFWLQPDKMAQLGLTTSDILSAIKDQNIQAAAGSFGTPPVTQGNAFEYSASVKGRLLTTDEFENIIIRSGADGASVRMKDVARTEMGSESYGVRTYKDGKPAAVFGVYQLPEANALNVARGVQKKMQELSKEFPAGMAFDVGIDNTKFVTESIKEVFTTLGLAFALVVVVVFIFLGNVRATLIPMLAVPVSLIGAFASFVVLGFSINLLTLFAMVLAIGLVVDDAIVVVEAVEHHIEEGLDPKSATIQAMQEVSGPVIGIALVLAAVFIPVAFMGGITGELYKQFALTLAVSVALSALVALTLTPALCTMILKPRESEGAFQKWFNNRFDSFTNRYVIAVRGIMRHAPLAICVLIAIYAATIGLVKTQPTAFLPSEDLGYLIFNVQLPDAASSERTMEVAHQVEAIVSKDPAVDQYLTLNNFSILTSSSASNAATIWIRLHPWDKRKSPELQVDAVLLRLQRQLSAIPGAFILGLNPPPIMGLGNAGGFQLELQDRGAHGPEYLQAALDQALGEARQRKELNPMAMFSGYSANVPQITVDVDREKTKQLGVPLSDVFATMQTYLGSYFINQFNLYGRTWRVYAQADANYRMTPEALNRIYVRGSNTSTTTGTSNTTATPFSSMIPLSTLVRAHQTSAPSTYSRYNLYTTAEISGSAAPGYSSGAAITAMEDIMKHMPSGIGYEWTGTSLQEKESGGKQIQIFALALVFVFLVLAALYENWAIPFSVLLGVPLGVLGAFVGIHLLHIDNDVYVQIGLVTLIGLAAKNAILIVEFAKIEHEQHGLSLVEAAVKGARLRLRPILMTSFAFIFGVAPMAFATGAGASSRHSLGTAVCAGMLFATSLGIFFIPLLYVLVEGVKEKFFGAPKTVITPTPPLDSDTTNGQAVDAAKGGELA